MYNITGFNSLLRENIYNVKYLEWISILVEDKNFLRIAILEPPDNVLNRVYQYQMSSIIMKIYQSVLCNLTTTKPDMSTFTQQYKDNKREIINR